jgi:sec-independent protein translocase protein TatB
VFNLSGGEIVVLLLIGLVVLGPEKLPEAMRKFGRVYNEVRRVAGGIQRDVTSTFSEPVNELKKTANEARRIFSGAEDPTSAGAPEPADPPFVPYEAPAQPEATESAPRNPSDDGTAN